LAQLNNKDKIELDKILWSVEGRLDKNLIRLTKDLILKTNWTNNLTINLCKSNINNIPDKSLNAFLLGNYCGQCYQISLNLAKKLELTLTPNQKNVLKEFVFFLVLIYADKK